MNALEQDEHSKQLSRDYQKLATVVDNINEDHRGQDFGYILLRTMLINKLDDETDIENLLKSYGRSGDDGMKRVLVEQWQTLMYYNTRYRTITYASLFFGGAVVAAIVLSIMKSYL